MFAAHANVRDAHLARFVQANAMAMPFPKRSFDFVFSIGVAQHTPDPLEFLRSAAEAVAPGGRAAFWVYERRLDSVVRPKYLLRPITSRMSAKTNMRFSEALVDGFFPLAQRLAKLPGIVRKIALRSLPIATYLDQLPLSEVAQREWSVLDTLDWYSPRFDKPQKFADVAGVLTDAGATRVVRGRAPGLTADAWF